MIVNYKKKIFIPLCTGNALKYENRLKIITYKGLWICIWLEKYKGLGESRTILKETWISKHTASHFIIEEF